MEWIDCLNQAIRYIEEHLTEEIDYECLGKAACCSAYHFQRMFAYMAEVPLSEYIRRRRMSLAAADLKCTDEKVVELALKYGYQSPTAFNRAFQSVHGITPSAARKTEVPVKSYPPISFKLKIKGVEEMNYRLEQKESLRIVGVRRKLRKKLEENFEIVPKMWETVAEDGTVPRLTALMDREPSGVLGISFCQEPENWNYMIAVSSGQEPPEGMEEAELPSRTWAIFSGEGECPGAIQELERRIYTEWMTSSGYEYDQGPDVELYLSPNPQQAKFEVWVPVKKK